MGMTLGDLAKKCCLKTNQTRGNKSHSCIVGEEEVHWAVKMMVGELYFKPCKTDVNLTR